MNVGAARRRAPMTSGISRGSYGTQVLASSAPRAPLHVNVAPPNCLICDGKGLCAESVVTPGPVLTGHPDRSLQWTGAPRTEARRSAYPLDADRTQAPDFGHPALGEPVGGRRGGYALAVGQRQDLLGGVVNLGRAQLRPLEVEALDLVGDLDHAARVHHVVRC